MLAAITCSITAYSAAWFAMLARVAPVARRGRTFGLVSAGSNFASLPVALAGLTLLWLPSERGDLR